jgi:hypothetical protein
MRGASVRVQVCQLLLRTTRFKLSSFEERLEIEGWLPMMGNHPLVFWGVKKKGFQP